MRRCMEIRNLSKNRYYFKGIQENSHENKPRGFKVHNPFIGVCLSILGKTFKEDDKWVNKKSFKKYVNRLDPSIGIDKDNKPKMIFQSLMKRQEKSIIENAPSSHSPSSISVTPPKEDLAPILKTEKEDVKKAQEFLEYYENSDVVSFDQALKDQGLRIEKLPVEALTVLFAHQEMRFMIVDYAHQNQLSEVLFHHCNYTIDRAILRFQPKPGKSLTYEETLIGINEYLVKNHVFLNEVIDNRSLIDKFAQSSLKPFIEQYLSSSKNADVVDIAQRISNDKITVPNEIDGMFYSTTLGETYSKNRLNYLLSCEGLSLNQLFLNEEAVKIIVENMRWHSSAILYANDYGLRSVLKICWEHTAREAMDKFSDLPSVRNLFKLRGMDLDDFKEQWGIFQGARFSQALHLVDESDHSKIKHMNAQVLAQKHAQEGKDLVAFLGLEAFRDNETKLKKEALKILLQSHSDKKETERSIRNRCDDAIELKSLIADNLYQFYLEEYNKFRTKI